MQLRIIEKKRLLQKQNRIVGGGSKPTIIRVLRSIGIAGGGGGCVRGKN